MDAQADAQAQMDIMWFCMSMELPSIELPHTSTPIIHAICEDIVDEIAKHFPRDWLYVSRRYHKMSFARLLADPRVDPSRENCVALHQAAERGHVNVVRLLLQDPRVDINSLNGSAICDACRAGQTEVVKLLLADPRLCLEGCYEDPVEITLHNKHVEIAKMLFEDHRVDITDINTEAVRAACTGGSIEIVEMLLANESVPVDNIDEDGGRGPICFAVYSGNIELVRRMLDREDLGRRLNIPVDGLQAIDEAIEKENGEMIILLMEHPEITNYIDYNALFKEVFRQNMLNIAEHILENRPYIPSYKLMMAILKGEISEARYIIENDVGGEENDSWALAIAASKGQDTIVKLMLDEYTWENIDAAFDYARINNQRSTMKLFLADPRLTKSVCSYAMGRTVSDTTGEDSELVKWLLDDGRVDPNDKNGQFLSHAIARGYYTTVKLLLTDPRTRLDRFGQWSLLAAIKNNKVDIVLLLLSDSRCKINYDSIMQVIDLKKQANLLAIIENTIAIRNLKPKKDAMLID